MPIPDEIENRPVPYDGLEPYYDDYLVLAQFAGADRIKISEVFAYAAGVGMSDEYRDNFIAYIPAMDLVRLEYIAEQVKQKNDAGTISKKDEHGSG